MGDLRGHASSPLLAGENVVQSRMNFIEPVLRSAILLENDVSLQLFNLWKRELLQCAKKCGTSDSFRGEEKQSNDLLLQTLKLVNFWPYQIEQIFKIVEDI